MSVSDQHNDPSSGTDEAPQASQQEAHSASATNGASSSSRQPVYRPYLPATSMPAPPIERLQQEVTQEIVKKQYGELFLPPAQLPHLPGWFWLLFTSTTFLTFVLVYNSTAQTAFNAVTLLPLHVGAVTALVVTVILTMLSADRQYPSLRPMVRVCLSLALFVSTLILLLLVLFDGAVSLRKVHLGLMLVLITACTGIGYYVIRQLDLAQQHPSEADASESSLPLDTEQRVRHRVLLVLLLPFAVLAVVPLLTLAFGRQEGGVAANVILARFSSMVGFFFTGSYGVFFMLVRTNYYKEVGSDALATGGRSLDLRSKALQQVAYEAIYTRSPLNEAGASYRWNDIKLLADEATNNATRRYVFTGLILAVLAALIVSNINDAFLFNGTSNVIYQLLQSLPWAKNWQAPSIR